MSVRNIGNQAAGIQQVQFPPGDHKSVCRFQNLSGADLLVSKFYGDWGLTYSNVKVRAVIYSDNAGSPGTLLAVSNERTQMPTRWNAFTFPTPVTVANNAYVWCGVIANTTLTSNQCSSGGTLYYNYNPYDNGAPATFGSGVTQPYTYRMFLEGEDGTTSFGRRSIDITGIAAGDGNYQTDREHVEKAILGGSGSVTATSISTYIRNTTSTVKCKAAIYSDNAGYPGTKLAQTSEVTGATADTWLTLPIPGGVVLTPGTYWLAFISSENLTTSVIPYSGSLIADGPMTEATAFPSAYPTTGTLVFDPVTDGRGIDIYASYSEGGVIQPVSSARPYVFICT